MTERARVTHELKTWPEFFEQTLNGREIFELRRNDRDFRVGDELLLREWKLPLTCDDGKGGQTIEGHYTGRELKVRIDYIMDSLTLDRLMHRFEYGAQMSGYVIMSVSLVS